MIGASKNERSKENKTNERIALLSEEMVIFRMLTEDSKNRKNTRYGPGYRLSPEVENSN
jgi:hypothetical protein